MSRRRGGSRKARRHFRLRKKVVGRPSVRAWSSRGPRGTCSRRSSTTPAASPWPRRSTFKLTDGDKTAQAREVGTQVAEAAKAAGVTKVVFDRGGNTYTGRIAALADAAREAGLEF